MPLPSFHSYNGVLQRPWSILKGATDCDKGAGGTVLKGKQAAPGIPVHYHYPPTNSRIEVEKQNHTV